MRLFRYYIGANNATKQVERDTVRRIVLSSFPDGFTVLEGHGVWNDGSEPMVIVELITNEIPAAWKLAQTLKRALKQESVLVANAPFNGEFV